MLCVLISLEATLILTSCVVEYLLLLQSLLSRVYILLHSHVYELILSLCLHHARPLLPYSLDGLRDVDVTIETQNTHIQKLAEMPYKDFDKKCPVLVIYLSLPPWRLITSIRMSMTIMVPVLPMPALWGQQSEKSNVLLLHVKKFSVNVMRKIRHTYL